MLSVPVIASNVEARCKIHKALQFRNELQENLTEEKTMLTKRLGNCTAETMFTFEYGMKPLEDLLKMEDIDMTKITHFPFQTVVEYTAQDGSKCLRVITKKLEVTGERDELEREADQNLLQQNAISKGTQFARAGNIHQAQAIFKAFKRGNMRGEQSVQKQAAQEYYNNMVNEIYQDFNEVRAQVSDAEDEMMEQMDAMPMQAAAMEIPPQQVSSKNMMNDRVSTMAYQMSANPK